MRYLSLFDGIGAVHCAWLPLGWECVGTAEIEAFPAAVVEHHYGFPNLGDVTQITDEQIAALGPIDLVVGGSPCQDLSVAGKRAGLAGARSGLFHHQLRIFHAARTHCGARYLLWENVPGAFSTHGGRDFACVVGAMAGCDLNAPADGWGSEGVALGANGLVEWCVLDAQWFGVAQRRRRVFALLDVGAWADRPPILLEPDRLRGDSAPRRETGERPTGSIAARTRGGGGLGTDFDLDGGLIPQPHADITPAIKARDSKGVSSDGDGDGAILVPMVTRSLRADGFDAGEDGTSRGTPLVQVAMPEETAPTLFAAYGTKWNGNAGVATGQLVPMVSHCDQHSPTLDKSKVPAIAFDPQGAGKQTRLGASTHGTGALGTTKTPAVATAMQVRRLTPRECERLQGFPDDYTAIQMRGKPAADGPRYKSLGNSMAVPVMAWIGRQIAVRVRA